MEGHVSGLDRVRILLSGMHLLREVLIMAELRLKIRDGLSLVSDDDFADALEAVAKEIHNLGLIYGSQFPIKDSQGRIVGEYQLFVMKE